MPRGGRKRCRGSLFHASESSSGCANGCGGGHRRIQVGGDAEIDTSGFGESLQHETSSSRCSVHLIYDVVSKFDTQKMSIVEEIGFQGILKFPPIKQFNRRFGLWLMSCVDAGTQTLKIGEDISIKFDKSDVAHVFGIPSSGKAVLDPRLPAREAKDIVLNSYLGARFKESRSIKFVQEIIERDYALPMNQVEVDTFKVAFMVFVVSILLAPSAKHDYASIDYWNALSDPGALHTYDWCEFVVRKLVDASLKLREDIASNVKFLIISGCCIFLQVLYLDSIELDGFMLRHNSFPRIREFTYDRIRLMIADDRNFRRQTSGDDDLPPVKLRDPVGCVYSWASRWRRSNDSSSGGSQLALWQCAVATVHFLDIPLEAAGPVFVALADFQEKVNSGMYFNGTEALTIMSVLISIMMPYKRGGRQNNGGSSENGNSDLADVICNGTKLLSNAMNYEKPATCGLACVPCSENGQTSKISDDVVWLLGLQSREIGAPLHRSFNSVVNNRDSPDYFVVDKRVASAMCHFYSVLSSMKARRSLDLNSSITDCSHEPLTDSDTGGSSNLHLPSPWDLDYKWISRDIDIAELTRQIRCLHNYEGMVIIHRSPKFIQISGKDLYNQVIGECEMEQDLFDVLVRSLCHQDDVVYAAYGDRRWRRVFESDFMDSILNGGLNVPSHGDVSRVSASITPAELNNAKLLFFSALLQCTWVCFVWSLEDNVIYVYEASQNMPVDEHRVSLIEWVCSLLKLGLDSICRGMQLDSSRHPQNAVVRLLTTPDSVFSRFNRTGALCYMFCCCFDGAGLVPPFSLRDKEVLPAKIYEGCLLLKDNSGKFPDNHTQNI